MKIPRPQNPVIEVENKNVSHFQNLIIEWYKEYGRKSLPWRNTKNPWFVLIAGILLRKTTTNQVTKIYTSFITKYNNPDLIIQSPINEIKQHILTLGLENIKTEQLIKMANQIKLNYNEVPTDYEELKKLCGVGDYIASEVVLIAFDQPSALLDTNMIRVLSRVFSIKPKKKRAHTDKTLWTFANQLVPTNPEQAKVYNFGVLDFANSICKYKNPKCSICILRKICDYQRDNE